MIQTTLFHVTRALLRGGLLVAVVTSLAAALSSTARFVNVKPGDSSLESISTGVVAFVLYCALALGARWFVQRPSSLAAGVRRVARDCALVLAVTIALTVALAFTSLESPVTVAGLLTSLGLEGWLFLTRWLRSPRGPQPGQVWYAEVPFEESSESKDRPFLIMSARSGEVVGLMLTSQDKSHKRDYVPVRPPAHERKDGKDTSYLKLDRVITLPSSALRRSAWQVDQDVWDLVHRYHPQVFANQDV